MNTNRPKITIARRVRPNAKIPFNTSYCSRTRCRPNTTEVNAKTRGVSGFAARQNVEKYRALGYDASTRPQPLDDLVVARVFQSDFHRSFREVMTIAGEPHGQGAVALANDSVHRRR